MLRSGNPAARWLAEGLVAGALSAAVLAWRSRREAGRPWGAVNAPSHWIWGERALRRDGASARYTALGLAIHQASSFFWAVFYRVMRQRRRQPTLANALGDAALLTGVAAAVDLCVVPQRLTPGFEKRLSPGSLVLVYASFAVGLGLAAAMPRARPAGSRLAWRQASPALHPDQGDVP